MQIGTKYIHDDLRGLVEGIKVLVGGESIYGRRKYCMYLKEADTWLELDFSYHIVSTTDSGRNESEETLVFRKAQGESRGPQVKRD